MSWASKMASEPSFEHLTSQYVALIDSTTPNAHGQHIHPEYGRSDQMLQMMCQRFGARKVDDEISRLLNERMMERRRRFNEREKSP